jgi:uncharacterized Zn finger protein (UPF0148 family)
MVPRLHCRVTTRRMDESAIIDWYDVAEQVANGRFTGHACPLCGARPLETSTEGAMVRVRCPTCGEGFEARLGHGRDDALYAEAQEMAARQRAAKAAAARATRAHARRSGRARRPQRRPLCRRSCRRGPAPPDRRGPTHRVERTRAGGAASAEETVELVATGGKRR